MTKKPPFVRILHNKTVHKGIRGAAAKAGVSMKLWCTQIVTKALDNPRMFDTKRTVEIFRNRKPYPPYVEITMAAKTHQRVAKAASKAGVHMNFWCSNVVQTALSGKGGTRRPPARARSSRRMTTAGPGRIAPLDENAYYRETQRRGRRIRRRHNSLSNSFAGWLRLSGYSQVRQEKGRVDVEFTHRGKLCRAELKVCYEMNSTHAIREALGQLLEYNYYANRAPANRWLVLLDEVPTSEDKKFVNRLRTKLGLPVYVGWQADRTFTLLDW